MLEAAGVKPPSVAGAFAAHIMVTCEALLPILMSKRRSQIEVLAQVALVQVLVAHHHHATGVSQDAAETFDVSPIP